MAEGLSLSTGNPKTSASGCKAGCTLVVDVVERFFAIVSVYEESESVAIENRRTRDAKDDRVSA